MAPMTPEQMEASWQQYQAQQKQPAPVVKASSPSKMTPQQMEASWQAYQAQQSGGAPPQENPQQPQQDNSFLSSLVNNPVSQFALNAGQTIKSGLQQVPAAILQSGQNAASFLTGGAIPKSTLQAEGSPNPITSGAIGLGSAFALPMGGFTKTAEALSKVPAVGKILAKVAPTALNGAGYGALFSNADPNANAQDVGLGAALGAAVPVGLQAAFKGISNMIPWAVNKSLDRTQKKTEMNRSINPPQTVQNILNAQDRIVGKDRLPINIGKLTNTPFSKGYYEYGSKAPLAGQQQKIQDIVSKVDDASNDIYNGITKGEDPSTENIIQRVQDTGKEIKAKAKDEYDTLFKNAKNSGLTDIKTPGLQTSSKTLLDQMKWDVDQNLPHYLEDPSSKGIVQLLNKYQNPVELKVGRPVVPGMRNVGPSNTGGLENLKEIRTQIRSVENSLDKRSPLYGQQRETTDALKKAINEDIGFNIDSTGNPSLKKEWATVNSNYQKNNVPLKNIADILRGDKIGDTAIDKIMNSPKVLPLLNQETKNLLGARMLMSAVKDAEREGFNTKMNVSTAKLVNGYNRKNVSQDKLLSALFTPNTRKDLEALNTIHKATEAYRPMSTSPNNGQKAANVITKGGIMAAIVTLLHTPKMALDGLSAATGGLSLNRGLLNLMSNPVVARAYADPKNRQMILQQLKSQMPSIPGVINANKYVVNQYPSSKVNPAGLAYLLNQ